LTHLSSPGHPDKCKNMLRVFDEKFCGWHAFNAGAHTREVQHILKTQCPHLNAKPVPTPGPCTFMETSYNYQGISTTTEFTFTKTNGRSISEVECVDLTLKQGRSYDFLHGGIRHYDGEDVCSITWASGLCEKRRLLFKNELDGEVVIHTTPTEQQHPCQAYECTRFVCKSQGVVRLVRLHIHVMHTTTMVLFVYNEKCRSCVRINASPPVCVNACYTAQIHGSIDARASARAFCIETGSCGVEFSFPSSLGKVNIYKSEGNTRKVTFKAFSLLEAVKLALNTICSITGTTSTFNIKMHMLVFECKTGVAMDIRAHGFVHDFVNQVYGSSGCTFLSEVEEVNVHAIVQWNQTVELFRQLFPGHSLSPDTEEQLHALVLVMSITRLGTIIFRVSLKQDDGRRQFIPYSLETEQAIAGILNKLHTSFCTFEVPFG